MGVKVQKWIRIGNYECPNNKMSPDCRYLGKNMNKDRIIPTMIREINKKNKISIYGEGKRVTNFIEINKLYDFVTLLIKKNKTGLYNMGDYNYSYLNLAKKIKSEYGNSQTKISILKKGKKNKFNLNINKLNKTVK